MLFLYCFAYSEAKKTSMKVKKNGNYVVRTTGELSYSYSTQTAPYDLVFLQLVPVFFPSGGHFLIRCMASTEETLCLGWIRADTQNSSVPSIYPNETTASDEFKSRRTLNGKQSLNGNPLKR